MAKSAKRKKLQKSKLRAKVKEQAGYLRGPNDPANLRTKYGKRVMARRRGEPMAAREHPPWWAQITARASKDTAGDMYDKRERA